MKRFLLILALVFLAGPAFAQEYTANTWASWASVTTQVSWTFPFNSRTITILNGSNQPVCVAFNNVTINAACSSTVANQGSTGNNKVFQIPGSQWITLNNVVAQTINLKSAGTAASPVSVLVNY